MGAAHLRALPRARARPAARDLRPVAGRRRARRAGGRARRHRLRADAAARRRALRPDRGADAAARGARRRGARRRQARALRAAADVRSRQPTCGSPPRRIAATSGCTSASGAAMPGPIARRAGCWPRARSASRACCASRSGTPSRRPPAFCDPAVSGGIEIDCGVHECDLAAWLCGSPVVEAFARGAPTRSEIAAVGDVESLVGLLVLAAGQPVVARPRAHARPTPTSCAARSWASAAR